MKILPVLLILLLLLFLGCSDQKFPHYKEVQLYIIKHNGKFGHIDNTGRIVINPQFENASDFQEGFAMVRIGGKFGFIDKTGKEVIKPQFEKTWGFEEGLAAVKVKIGNKYKWGYIDKTGKMVIKPQFEETWGFREGLAPVKVKVGDKYKWVYIDKTGKIAIKIQFEESWGFGFREGLAVVKEKIGDKYKCGYIDKTGKEVIKPQFEDAFPFSKGLAPVKIRSKWGYIDKIGSLVIEPMFDKAYGFSEGLAPVKIRSKWGYIDKKGKVAIKPQFDNVFHFKEGLAPVSVKVGKEDRWGYIDKRGKIIIKHLFDYASNFREGIATVGIGVRIYDYNIDWEKLFYINKKGDAVWDPHNSLIEAYNRSILEGNNQQQVKVEPKTSIEEDELKTYELHFKEEIFPDGYQNHRYSYILKPENGTPPFKYTINSGTLPSGIILNSKTNSIEGEPNQKGVWKFKIKISDAEGKMGKLDGVIKIYRILSVGTNGTFKGEDGIQMAINSAEDLDAICIESGKYKITGLKIIKSKSWEHGIKISGGWDSLFTKSGALNKENTIFDGGVDEGEKKGKKEGILNIESMKGVVQIEHITFQNSEGSGVSVGRKKKDKIFFSNCSFLNNSSKNHFDYAVKGGTKIFENCIFKKNFHSVDDGGTFKNCTFEDNPGYEPKYSFYYRCIVIQGYGIFTECSFKNNYGISINGSGEFTNCKFENISGQAIFGKGNFKNCSFSNNTTKSSYRLRGGVVFIDSSSTFIDCIFNNNSSVSGGVVTLSGEGTFIKCTFTKNSSLGDGGAIGAEYTGKGNFIDCMFLNNSAVGSGGAIQGGRANYITNCLFINNSSKKYGGALFTKGSIGEYFIINSTFYQNRAKDGGGAFVGSGKILNSIFFKNKVGTEENDINAGEQLEIDYSLVNILKGPANFGAHNIKGDPKFIDSENGNFKLQTDSPCINVGKISTDMKLKVPSKDLAGKSRIVGGEIDMGAYECQK